MSAKGICEATGKDILNRHLSGVAAVQPCRFAAVGPDTDWDALLKENPWLATEVMLSMNLIVIDLKTTSLNL